MKKYPNLFSPLRLGKTYFKSRVWASPAGHHELTPDCFPDSETAAYYEMRARGGVASVCVGDCIIHSSTGQSHVKQIHIDDPLIIPSLTAVATAISRHGCVASAELSHGGKYSNVPELAGGEIESDPYLKQGKSLTYGPVADISPGGHEILEMPEELIFEIIEAFGRSAAVAKLCGFQMVTVHGGHGWLLQQFMSDKVNTRTDDWGGSFEKRMRLPLAVIESIRRHVGHGFPIEFRMSGDECSSEGYGIDYGIKIAEALDGKVDLIHVSTGNHEAKNGFIITHPNLFLDEGANVRFATAIKKRVKTPVATVGALSDPAFMEEIIASGKADVVQFARQLLADPEWVNKVRDGREDDIQRCLRCQTCFSYAFSNRCHRCAINPKLGSYTDMKYAAPITERRRVLVVGGGVAGMQAALTAADRGHDVILCEKSDRLGGVLNMERSIDFKFRVSEYLDRQIRKVGRQGIEVRLGTEVTPELATYLRPDAIIVCAGAVPVKPPVVGIDDPSVLSLEEALADLSAVGRSTVIIGAGFAGLETAIWLAMQGIKVSVVEMADSSCGENVIHAMAVKVQLDKYGIDVNYATKALRIVDGSLVCLTADGETVYSADTYIYAAGQRPLWETADALAFCAPYVNVVGDARSPRTIADATREAYSAAMDI